MCVCHEALDEEGMPAALQRCRAIQVVMDRLVQDSRVLPCTQQLLLQYKLLETLWLAVLSRYNNTTGNFRQDPIQFVEQCGLAQPLLNCMHRHCSRIALASTLGFLLVRCTWPCSNLTMS